MEEFINISDIQATPEDQDYIEEYDSYLKTHGTNIYQIQPINNSPEIKITHIGILVNPHDIQINQFDYNNYIGRLLNPIYDLELLKKSADQNIFYIIKLLVYPKNSDNPLACLGYNFIPDNKIQNIQDYIFESGKIIKNTQGIFSIRFNFTQNNKPKYLELEKFENHIQINQVFNKLINWLTDKLIINLINPQ